MLSFLPILAPALLPLAAVGLFTRFRRPEDLLRSPTRARLLQLVRERPGLALAEAARGLGLSRNAVAYHVHALRRAGALDLVPAPGGARLRLRGMPAPTLPPPPRSPVAAALLAALRAAPEGLPRGALHRLLPHAPQRTRNHHLRRLLDAGLAFERPTRHGPRLCAKPWQSDDHNGHHHGTTPTQSPGAAGRPAPARAGLTAGVPP